MIGTPDMLRKMQSVAVWIALPIERGFVIKADRVGDQGISFPPANRVSHPKLIRILVVRPPIGINSAYKVIELEKHNHLAGSLNDLHRKVEKIDPRHTRRKTIENWIAQDRGWAGAAVHGICPLEF